MALIEILQVQIGIPSSSSNLSCANCITKSAASKRVSQSALPVFDASFIWLIKRLCKEVLANGRRSAELAAQASLHFRTPTNTIHQFKIPI